MSAERRDLRLRIHGRVQGVGFRWWTRREAGRLGVDGWVRNCPDGTVEVRLAGAAEAVEAMRRSLEEGPPVARVERMEVVPVEDAVEAGSFEIRR